MLLSHAADIEAADRQKRNTLHSAANHGDKAVVGGLLGHGANIHVKDGSGRTALRFAAYWECETVIQLLLAHQMYDAAVDG